MLTGVQTLYSHRCCLMYRTLPTPFTIKIILEQCENLKDYVLHNNLCFVFPSEFCCLWWTLRGEPGSPTAPDGCQFPGCCLVSCSQSSRLWMWWELEPTPEGFSNTDIRSGVWSIQFTFNHCTCATALVRVLIDYNHPWELRSTCWTPNSFIVILILFHLAGMCLGISLLNLHPNIGPLESSPQQQCYFYAPCNMRFYLIW